MPSPSAAVLVRSPHRLSGIDVSPRPVVQRVLAEMGASPRKIDSEGKVDQWMAENGVDKATNHAGIRAELVAFATHPGSYSLTFIHNMVEITASDGKVSAMLAQFPEKTISAAPYHPSMRLQPAAPDYKMLLLTGAASMDRALAKIEHKKRAVVSSGKMPVLTAHPERDSGEHRRVFQGGTGHPSAAEHVRAHAPDLVDFGKAFNNTANLADFEITHLVGHSVAGTLAQTIENLVSATSGANTEMIAWENAVIALQKELPGAEIMITVDAEVLKNSRVALRILMIFYLDGHLLHKELISALRPTPFTPEFEATKERARKTLFGAARALQETRMGSAAPRAMDAGPDSA